MSALTVDSNEIDLERAKDILARLERYAASVRTAPRDPQPIVAPAVPKHPMAAPADDLLPVAVPWPYPGRPEGRRADPLFAPAQPDAERRRIDPATVDLFPYDLAASIVACALIVMAYISFGRPVAIAATVALAAGAEWMRRARWFPSVGLKLLIGTLAGLILVFTA